jgi:hypothetical protein
MEIERRYQDLTTQQLLAAYLFAHWHVRRMPRITADDRLQRAVWCRDHCNTFAGRWYAMGATAWLVQISPIGFVLSPAGVPLLGLFFLLAFSIGVHHMVWQVRAQEVAGLPPIDPPADMEELRRPAERRPSERDKSRRQR